MEALDGGHDGTYYHLSSPHPSFEEMAVGCVDKVNKLLWYLTFCFHSSLISVEFEFMCLYYPLSSKSIACEMAL